MDYGNIQPKLKSCIKDQCGGLFNPNLTPIPLLNIDTMIQDLDERRPPADVTREFLEMLIDRFGADFFAKIFGEKGADKLTGLGGAQAVAIAFTEGHKRPSLIETYMLSPDGSAASWEFVTFTELFGGLFASGTAVGGMTFGGGCGTLL
uniref:Uncharacterized protein n=1 Tax=Romanomermis culicivorax TaxID=13658 RepID=A0A915JXH7_ROMCU